MDSKFKELSAEELNLVTGGLETTQEFTTDEQGHLKLKTPTSQQTSNTDK